MIMRVASIKEPALKPPPSMPKPSQDSGGPHADSKLNVGLSLVVVIGNQTIDVKKRRVSRWDLENTLYAAHRYVETEFNPSSSINIRVMKQNFSMANRRPPGPGQSPASPFVELEPDPSIRPKIRIDKDTVKTRINSSSYMMPLGTPPLSPGWIRRDGI